MDLGTATSLGILVVVFFEIIVANVIYLVVWALRRKPVTGVESMKGQSGIVVRDITENSGEVALDGVVWRAKLSDRDTTVIPKGVSIVVVDVSSLTLVVRRKEAA